MARASLPALAALLALAAAPLPAAALPFSALSSDSTPASSLGADLDVQVAGTTLTLSNTSSEFNIRALYFNASAAVTGLSLTSATHSDGNADVTAAWDLLTPDSANAWALRVSRAINFGSSVVGSAAAAPTVSFWCAKCRLSRPLR